jgi:hypothetical protein
MKKILFVFLLLFSVSIVDVSFARESVEDKAARLRTERIEYFKNKAIIEQKEALADFNVRTDSYFRDPGMIMRIGMPLYNMMNRILIWVLAITMMGFILWETVMFIKQKKPGGEMVFVILKFLVLLWLVVNWSGVFKVSLDMVSWVNIRVMQYNILDNLDTMDKVIISERKVTEESLKKQVITQTSANPNNNMQLEVTMVDEKTKGLGGMVLDSFKAGFRWALEFLIKLLRTGIEVALMKVRLVFLVVYLIVGGFLLILAFIPPFYPTAMRVIKEAVGIMFWGVAIALIQKIFILIHFFGAVQGGELGLGTSTGQPIGDMFADAVAYLAMLITVPAFCSKLSPVAVGGAIMGMAGTLATGGMMGAGALGGMAGKAAAGKLAGKASGMAGKALKNISQMGGKGGGGTAKNIVNKVMDSGTDAMKNGFDDTGGS